MNDFELRALYQRLVELRSDSERRSCVAPEKIVALAEATLAESDRLTLLTHVASCRYCQRDLSMARAVARTRQRRVTNWLRPFAAIAAVLMVAVLISRVNRDRTSGVGPEVMRSTDVGVAVVRPIGTIRETPVQFVWRSVPRVRRYSIEIMSAGGASIYSSDVADTTFTLPRPLPAGDYFWRITASMDDGSTRRSAAYRFDVRAP